MQGNTNLIFLHFIQYYFSCSNRGSGSDWRHTCKSMDSFIIQSWLNWLKSVIFKMNSRNKCRHRPSALPWRSLRQMHRHLKIKKQDPRDIPSMMDITNLHQTFYVVSIGWNWIGIQETQQYGATSNMCLGLVNPSSGVYYSIWFPFLFSDMILMQFQTWSIGDEVPADLSLRVSCSFITHSIDTEHLGTSRSRLFLVIELINQSKPYSTQ